MKGKAATEKRVEVTRDGPKAEVRFSGAWRCAASEDLSGVTKELLGAQEVTFQTDDLENWDSGLAVQIKGLLGVLRDRKADVDLSGLPKGMQRLLVLSGQGFALEAKGDGPPKEKRPFFYWVGTWAHGYWKSLVELFAFIGEVSVGGLRMIRGKARFRREDFVTLLEECGAGALPIISMISLVIGVIFAFVGSVQLRLFGAQVYVADIVGIAMAREMGAMMTGIIMAGRTGAAFAAQLGTMQVNEEVDALTTMGMNPVEYLVVPRMAALLLMMPLLCVYAIFLGITGGMIIGVVVLDISMPQYLAQTQAAVDLVQFIHGITKSGVYGVIIAVAGCYHGMRCGRSASAVGEATTKAVVSSIVAIILADGAIAVMTSIIGV
ncbi:MAG: ABC transporter permease [Desulfobacterales bacterium]|nr:ABC transporter permease [Desulfobacterales bacterium]